MSITILLIFHLILFFKPCVSSYAEETSLRMVGKLDHMDYELLKDVFIKVTAVEHLQKVYYKNIAYQMGVAVYEVRYNYKIMVQLFHKTRKETKNPDLRLNWMIEVERRGLHVDQIIRMIEQYERDDEMAREQVLEEMSNPPGPYEARKDKNQAPPLPPRAMWKVANPERAPLAKEQKYAEDGFE